jgi:hemolysin activation/secretion protein
MRLIFLASAMSPHGVAWGALPADPAASTAPAGQAPEAHFNIHEYRILGNTVLSNRDIETVLYPLLGDDKTLNDVESARAALEKTYHDRGFSTVFVDIPEQEISEQIVRLKVTEGRLRDVHIAGARYFSERKILTAMPAAAAGAVPNVPELQKQLTAVNIQSGDRSVVPILKAGPTPGTVDLALKVDDHLPLHGSLELNNEYTPDTKPLRAIVGLSYSNLFGEFDTLSVQYQAAPQAVSDVNVLAANYAWGTFGGEIHPSVYFINSNSNVATIGTIGVIGKGQIYGTRFSYSLTDTPTAPQSLTWGADYKHFRESIGLSVGEPLVTPISYVNLTLGYAGNWVSDRQQGSFGAAVNFGPRAVPNDPDAFANKRFKGHPNYFYLRSNASYITQLPWGFRALVRIDGQFTAEPLISNEEFSIAGFDGVRGYLEAEALGDIALKGTAQIESPVIHWRVAQLGNILIFFDAARAGLVNALPGEPAETTLRSWGLGLNFLPGKPVTGSLTWAYALLDGPRTHGGDSRLLFVIHGGF